MAKGKINVGGLSIKDIMNIPMGEISTYSLTDIKKRLLKCNNISSECKIFRDVAAVVFINIPKRYENFLADIFYNEYEMDMFFESYGYERMVFKYNVKKEELSYIDYGEE